MPSSSVISEAAAGCCRAKYWQRWICPVYGSTEHNITFKGGILMQDNISGIHHITAISADAQRNHDFYTRVLGLRLVKKTVNFDDPGTYHFYYGDENGTPGTILTFFPWAFVRKGTTGNGMATEIGYSVPAGSLDFWIDRFVQNKVKHEKPVERLGELILPFEDPDGLKINLVVPTTDDRRKQWTTNGINTATATKGFHSITLTLENLDETAKILTDIFDYKLLKQEKNIYR